MRTASPPAGQGVPAASVSIRHRVAEVLAHLREHVGIPVGVVAERWRAPGARGSTWRRRTHEDRRLGPELHQGGVRGRSARRSSGPPGADSRPPRGLGGAAPRLSLPISAADAGGKRAWRTASTMFEPASPFVRIAAPSPIRRSASEVRRRRRRAPERHFVDVVVPSAGACREVDAERLRDRARRCPSGAPPSPDTDGLLDLGSCRPRPRATPPSPDADGTLSVTAPAVSAIRAAPRYHVHHAAPSVSARPCAGNPEQFALIRVSLLSFSSVATTPAALPAGPGGADSGSPPHDRPASRRTPSSMRRGHTAERRPYRTPRRCRQEAGPE